MKRIIISLTLILLAFYVQAEVKLPNVISSDMMFQRNSEIKVWGWADKNESISVSFNGKTVKTKAGKDGKWMAKLPAMEAGGPHTMTIKAKNTIVLENILIGDIWVCSGQSNMEWRLSNSNNAEEEIKNANYPKIRLLQIPKNLQFFEVEDVPETSWTVCSPETVPSFSAVGYFFGRNVFEETGVPIGLINTSWGGTNAETWTSGDYIGTLEEYADRVGAASQKGYEEMLKKQELFIESVIKDFRIDKNKPDTEDWSAETVDLSLWKEAKVPGHWENSVLPGFDGNVWFRKEFNMPAGISEKEAILYLGAIDDGDITYINGKEVGNTPDSYDLSRVYKIKPGLLREGKNVISVKIYDKSGNGGFSGRAEELKIEADGLSVPLSGMWMYKPSAIFHSMPSNNVSPNQVPAGLYNGMIKPLLNLSITGVIWYQGESNAGRPYQYRDLFPLMIESWRNKWSQEDLPFLFVQLANFMAAKPEPGESQWAELRESQLMTLDKLDNTGMAVIIDIGEADDIHPRNKQDVGYRLALNALKIAYNKDIVSTGPVYSSVEFQEGKGIISFESVGSGLVAKDKYGYLKGFAIAGADKKFHWAQAKIQGGKVIVWSDDVKNPQSVRYAWADNPDDANLYNIEGLPASPFRTDDWRK